MLLIPFDINPGTYPIKLQLTLSCCYTACQNKCLFDNCRSYVTISCENRTCMQIRQPSKVAFPCKISTSHAPTRSHFDLQNVNNKNNFFFLRSFVSVVSRWSNLPVSHKKSISDPIKPVVGICNYPITFRIIQSKQNSRPCPALGVAMS
jgi:hypothetical protein